jgi:hypothetical protein
MHCRRCTVEALLVVQEQAQHKLKQHEAKIQRACSVLMPDLGSAIVDELSAKRNGDAWQFSWNKEKLDVSGKGGARHSLSLSSVWLKAQSLADIFAIGRRPRGCWQRGSCGAAGAMPEC